MVLVAKYTEVNQSHPSKEWYANTASSTTDATSTIASARLRFAFSLLACASCIIRSLSSMGFAPGFFHALPANLRSLIARIAKPVLFACEFAREREPVRIEIVRAQYFPVAKPHKRQ